MSAWTAADLGWTNNGQNWTLLVGRDGDALVVRRADLAALLECLDRSGARYSAQSRRGGRLARVQIGRFKPTGYSLPTGAMVQLRILAEPAMAGAA